MASSASACVGGSATISAIACTVLPARGTPQQREKQWLLTFVYPDVQQLSFISLDMYERSKTYAAIKVN